MKTYYIMISRYFPVSHARAGESTFFKEHILTALMSYEKGHGLIEKKHTIRSNYELWKKRIDEVYAGNAVLSLRYWEGKPYKSKQIEFTRLNKYSGIGVQKLEQPDNFVFAPIEGKMINWEDVAKNDGLSFEDFCEWFKSRQKEPMAIIQFTKYRY